MKLLILNYLNKLIDSETDDKILLQDKLAVLLSEAKLDMDGQKAAHTKKLILATIKSYVDTTDSALKTALMEHYKTLDTFLKDE